MLSLQTNNGGIQIAMVKKKLITSYPYVPVEGVDNRLLDFALIKTFYLQIDKNISKLIPDVKLINKTKKLTEGNDSIELLKLVYAYNLYSNYNMYNNLVSKLTDKMMDTADETFSQFTENDIHTFIVKKYAELKTEREQLDFLLEMVTFFRLYKKGRYASEYISMIIMEMREKLPDIIELFENETPEEEWLDQLLAYMEGIYVLEEELPPFVSEEIASLEVLKTQMMKLIDHFGESLSTVDPEDYENLCATLLEKEDELKSANKLLKNKDDQISKLQKSSAMKDKDVAVLTKKFDDLKKEVGTKATELSALRKTAEDATLKYEQLQKRQVANQESMQKELQRAREHAAQPLQIKLNNLKVSYDEKVDQLETDVESLQQTLNKERLELHAIEDEVGRLRYYQEFHTTLNSANVKLQDENENLQKELENVKKLLEQQVSIASYQTTPVIEDDAVQIDDGIFGMLMNTPEEVERNTHHMATVSAAPQSTKEIAQQAGSISIVTEENEINFDELLINRPE